MEGIPFEPFPGSVDNLAKGTGAHHVRRVDGSDYVIDPPLADGSNRIPAVDFEHAVIGAYYEREPCLVEARTPVVFLAALTVALLGCWIGTITGTRWPALLVPLAYATGPEVFVRSSYTGYTAVSNFAMLVILMAVDEYQTDRRPAVWRIGFLAGGFAGLANHKLILLPAALVVWQLLQRGQRRPMNRLAAGVLHPVVLGFLAGTAVFWLFGLSVNPAVFWRDHVGTHFVDRLTHHNPLGYQGYPSVAGLWIEFWQHTGYVLLPLAVVTLGLGCFNHGDDTPAEEGRLRRSSFMLWAVWTLLVAVAFSVVDWRQTKHLMPLVLVLHLAPIRWAAGRRGRLSLVGIVFLVVLAWNLWTLRSLVMDFESFPITPAW